MAGEPARKRRRGQASAREVVKPVSRPLSAVAARKAARLAAEQASPSNPVTAEAVPAPANGQTIQQTEEKDASDSDIQTFATKIIQEIVDEDTGPPGTRYFAPVAGPSKASSAIAHRAEVRARRQLEDDSAEELQGLSDAPSDVDVDSDDALPRDPDISVTPKVRSRGGQARRRAKQKERTSFYDPECVSRWTAVEDEKGRNVVRDSAGIWVGLHVDEREKTLIPCGTTRMRVVRGNVQVSGAVFTPVSPPVDIFAPSSHPLPVVRCLPPRDFLSSQIPESPDDLAAFASVVVLSYLETGIQDLDRPWTFGSSKRLFPLAHALTSSIHTPTFAIIDRLTPDVSSVRTPTSWTAALNRLDPSVPRFVGLIEGSKRVGKSTFCHLLVNHLLSTFESVAVLDLDPGQPLSGPPSIVSLSLVSSPTVGPSFTSLAPSIRAHYLGSLTPKDAPGTYVAAMEDLVGAYRHDIEFSSLEETVSRRWKRRSDVKTEPAQSGFGDEGSKRKDHVPLVVNTMGWTKGLGGDLLLRLKELVSPTDVFTFEDGPGAVSATSVLEPMGETPLASRMLPNDARSLSLLSYFHSVLPVASDLAADGIALTGRGGSGRWDCVEPLGARRPYCVPWGGDSPPLLGVAFVGRRPAEGQLGFALNGTVVGVVATSALPLDEGPLTSSIKVLDVPSPAESTCLGLALVRSLDPTTRTMQLLTPIPCATLTKHHHRLVLVKGAEPELPLVASLDWSSTSDGLAEDGVFGVGWESVPYLALSGSVAGAGGERRRVRRNLMRKGQVRA